MFMGDTRVLMNKTKRQNEVVKQKQQEERMFDGLKSRKRNTSVPAKQQF